MTNMSRDVGAVLPEETPRRTYEEDQARRGPGAALAPSIADLPPPPPGRIGWPWTEARDPLPDTMPHGALWPRITIVTPSYNQAEYLEETLRSVLLQGYPDLEYIVIDGASRDGSVEIIRRYEPWLTHWVSEPDRGQSHAINKGFGRATGQILAWLNSDDIYYLGTLERVAITMMSSSCHIYIGAMDKVVLRDGQTHHVKTSSAVEGTPFHFFPIFASGAPTDFHFIQPPMFWRRWVWETTGGLDERYHYVMDLEWCSRAVALGAQVMPSGSRFARFLLHGESKSEQLTHRFPREQAQMYWRLSRKPGFRRFQCYRAALERLQRAAALWSVRKRNSGQVVAAWLSLNGARALKLLQTTVAPVPARRKQISRGQQEDP